MTDEQKNQFVSAMCGVIEGLELRNGSIHINSERVVTVDADGDIAWYTKVDYEGAILAESESLISFSDGRDETERWIIEHPEEAARDYMELADEDFTLSRLITEAVAEFNAPEQPLPSNDYSDDDDSRDDADKEVDWSNNISLLIDIYNIKLLPDGQIGCYFDRSEYDRIAPIIKRHKAEIISVLKTREKAN